MCQLLISSVTLLALGLKISALLTALEFHCLPINSDKWNVHKHVRTSLGPFSSTAGENTKTIDFYLPINRQIRYLSSSTEPMGPQMFLVYWCDVQDTAATTTATTGLVNLQYRIVKYFKDSCTC